jgi:hypothetical protein
MDDLRVAGIERPGPEERRFRLARPAELLQRSSARSSPSE